MGLEKTSAIVIGSFPIGESDRVVTFFTRQFGKVRGVAKAARRMTSRFGSALELFTLGELVFFDTGRSDLVRVDHFDIVHPFARLREHLERLGHASWMVECAARLTAERDRQPALYGLLVRALRAMENGPRPVRARICFAVRLVDALGQRPRLDRCHTCGRPFPFSRPALDVEGLVCGECAPGSGAAAISPGAVAALAGLRGRRWEEAIATRLGRLERELAAVLETHMIGLIGQPTRTTKFLRELDRLAQTSGGQP